MQVQAFSASLSLRIAPSIPAAVQSRISYAFKIFAAIYGYQVLEEDRFEKATIRCFYGKNSGESQQLNVFYIPARYTESPGEQPAPTPRLCTYADQEIHLFYGVDEASKNPDWLGEIFEWLSSSYEMCVKERDSIGRIPYQSTLFGCEKLSPTKPYASLVMAWFQNYLENGGTTQSLPKARSPFVGVDHLVICSHDIDSYFTSRLQALKRLLKNLAISILVSRSRAFFCDNLLEIGKLLRGKSIGDFLPAFLPAFKQHDFRSTFFVIARSHHRRDANYRLEQIIYRLREVLNHGGALALHGSYKSVVEANDLCSEVLALEREINVRPMGSRQHWLRFDNHEKLFRNIAKSGLLYDSTLGFSDAVGFRNGAGFAFPPYDFSREEPYPFLEIPLVVMDTALNSISKSSPQRAMELAETVLDESRRWGWGGIAILWHNPLEPLGVPTFINDVFWTQLKKKDQYLERWMTAEEFLRGSLHRYQNAGLLISR
jgi:peptidoglycan/xylan/chitin deacetylase (PgdA/CDA1 family)